MKILLLLLITASFSFGQEIGGVSGRLVNDSLVGIPNAYLTVCKKENRYSADDVLSLRTDKDGCFSIDQLPAGSFQLSIQLNNEYYSDWMEIAVQITTNTVLDLDELIYRESVFCGCEITIVPYKPPLLDTFGSSTTFYRDDIIMR